MDCVDSAHDCFKYCIINKLKIKNYEKLFSYKAEGSGK